MSGVLRSNCCETCNAQKMKFSNKETVDLITFTEEILNGELHFLCSVVVIFPKSNFYQGVYQEQVFGKRDAFSERLQQLLINKRNI